MPNETSRDHRLRQFLEGFSGVSSMFPFVRKKKNREETRTLECTAIYEKEREREADAEQASTMAESSFDRWQLSRSSNGCALTVCLFMGLLSAAIFVLTLMALVERKPFTQHLIS